MISREICKLCYRVNAVGFQVPDDVWMAVVPGKAAGLVVCLQCFTQFADEKLIPWDQRIEFFPVSMATHLGTGLPSPTEAVPSAPDLSIDGWPDRRPGEPIDGRDIVRAVASHFRMSITTLLGKGRDASIVYARLIAYALAYQILPGASYPMVGKLLKRDHTSVMTGHKKFQRLVERGDSIGRHYDAILAKLDPERSRIVARDTERPGLRSARETVPAQAEPAAWEAEHTGGQNAVSNA